ncbi:MAG: hypothetical protein K2G45_00360 [Lachnospiraceae bacterium]|nr:hypothetical protein [Lachnospiraceae bacterium]
MAEKLYTIPVNDAFDSDCECPICAMHRDLEQNAVEYTMGPSYMEDDNRAITDKLGFCSHHMRILYSDKNKLGLALMMKTHTDKTIKDLKAISANKPVSSGGLFKKAQSSSVSEYINKLNESCFICDRIEGTFNRYIDTIFHLWKTESSFKEKFMACKGFCTKHYGILYDFGGTKLSKDAYSEFLDALNKVYFDNMERVNSDIGWFIDKFDYRYKDEPWKNAKDSIPRGIIKTNSTIIE